jgi:hypothetical protein
MMGEMVVGIFGLLGQPSLNDEVDEVDEVCFIFAFSLHLFCFVLWLTKGFLI